MELNAITQGDVLSVLKSWPAAFVQTVVTSPPYWGLRDYKTVGQIGLEKNVGEYIAKMVDIFREVRRVLKKDGTIWVNLGDTYAGSWGDYGGKHRGNGVQRAIERGSQVSHEAYAGMQDLRPPSSWTKNSGVKPKDLIGVPWRVALALQADGWYLRSDIIWNKPNPMPESVSDRPTKAHEYIFFMAKSRRYFYDAEAIREPLRDASLLRLNQDTENQQGSLRIEAKTNGAMKAVMKRPAGWSDHTTDNELIGRYASPKQNPAHLHDKDRLGGARRTKEFESSQGGGGTSFPGHSGYTKADGSPICGVTANKKTVWTVPTQGFKEAHFATFPEDLIAPCIKAGSRVGDVVLDPFMGSGTTAVVAKRFKRNWVGIDLNPEYIKIAERRISTEQDALIVE